MRIVLHVGMHKTGTSAIQSVLEENRTELSDSGWKYIFLSRQMPKLYQFLQGGICNSAGIDKELENIFEIGKERNYLFSHEDMTSALQPVVDWERKAEVIRDVFSSYGDLEIIYYFRRQDDFYESAFKQRAKEGVKYNLTETFKRLPPMEVMNWQYKLDRYVNIIKPCKLIVVSYDSDKEFLFQRFVKYIGIDNIALKIPKGKGAVNKSNSLLTLFFSLYGSTSDANENLRVSNYLNRIEENVECGMKYRLFNKELRREIFNTYYESNQILIKKSVNATEEVLKEWLNDIQRTEEKDLNPEEYLNKKMMSIMKYMAD